MTKLRVGVVFGGRSGEHEISLHSASAIIGALDPDRYEVVQIGISKEGRWLTGPDSHSRLIEATNGTHPVHQSESLPMLDPREFHGSDESRTLDVVFPVLHGPYGEDGTVQGLFEMAGLPYVGAGVLGSAAGMDKIVMKRLFRAEGLPIPDYMWFLGRSIAADPDGVAESIEDSLGYPCFVKPANLGSSVGISKSTDRASLRASLEFAARYDRRIIVEQGLPDVREMECSVLGNEDPMVSVPGEITYRREFYDYDAKYLDEEGTQMHIPADVGDQCRRELQRLAKLAFLAIDCSGMARVDFFVDRQTERVTVNEINTIPGFTRFSMYPKLWEASGIPFPELVDRLIALAIQRRDERNSFSIEKYG